MWNTGNATPQSCQAQGVDRKKVARYKVAMTITKARAKTILGLTSDEALAAILYVTRAAVQKWPDSRELAPPYLWVLYGKYPRKFSKPA